MSDYVRTKAAVLFVALLTATGCGAGVDNGAGAGDDTY